MHRACVRVLQVGMLICALSIALYNNVKPYDIWQNNVLQQFCQLNIFLTLLGGLVVRAPPPLHTTSTADTPTP